MTTTTEPFVIGSRVRYVGPGTSPDTGTVVDVVRQRNADDLYLVRWDHDEADRDLYSPTRLVSA